MTKPIAVLGCGPAGLLAAWAAYTRGHEVHVFSIKVKSPIGGAQYLHRAISGLTHLAPDSTITHVVHGDAGGYQAKAYGTGAQPAFVSFDHVADDMPQPAWNLRAVYDQLWDFFGDQIYNEPVDGTWVEANRRKFKMIVSSVPKRALCRTLDPSIRMQGVPTQVTHQFSTQQIQILNRCLPGGPEGPDNTLYYDGSDAVSWYRASKIFGTGSTEWGSAVQLPFPSQDVVKVWKPVATNCDCDKRIRNLMCVGRFGKWQKGELTHHAYENVMERLA